MSNREDYKDNRRVRHNTPRVGDAIYIEGKWKEQTSCGYGQCPGEDSCFTGCCYPTTTFVWVKAKLSRVNGRVVYVDRDSEEAKVSLTDHPYADVDESKTLHLPFSIFYGRWDANRDLFVLTDECVS